MISDRQATLVKEPDAIDAAVKNESKPTKLHALVVEDSADDADLMVLALKRDGFEVEWSRVDSIEDLASALGQGGWQIVLSDHDLPTCTSVDVLRLLEERAFDLPCLIVSGAIGEEAAVELLHQGAQDFVNKDSLKRLGPAVTRALRAAHERRARRAAEAERNRLLEQLDYERSLLKSVLLQMPAGVVIAEAPSGRLILNNRRAEEIWRMSPLGENLDEHYEKIRGVHAGGRTYQPHEWPLARAMRSGESVFAEEIEITRNDLSQGVIRGSAVPVRDVDGNVAAAVAVFDDITEQKALENALKDSEARFRAMAEAVPGIVLMIDPDGTVDYLNPFFYEYTGLSRNAGTGTIFRHVLHPDDSAAVREQWLRLTEDHAASPIEFRIRRADGSFCWFMSRVSAICDNKGRIAKCVGVVIEIHELKEAQAELKAFNESLEARVEERTKELQAANEEIRRSEQRFSNVFYASPTPIIVTSLEADVVIDVNDSCTQVIGCARDDLLGRTTSDLGIWQQAPFADRSGQLRRLVNTGSLRNVECELLAADGRAKDVLASFEVVELGGEECVVTMFVDVTDRKRTEEQLMTAIQEVMSDTQWFSRKVLEKLAQVKSDEGVPKTEIADLTRRERQVLTLVAHGKRNDEIAIELGIAAQTVRNYMATIYDKTSCRSRAQAVVWARERGLV